MISEQMLEKIKKQLTESPLTDADELRRVEGMGHLYMSLSLDHADECSYLYSITIDETKYYFFTTG